MLGAKAVVSRIEFRTDMMRAASPVLPLGFMVEVCWGDARWLGLLYRPSLTHNELESSDSDTWPELLDLTKFHEELFRTAWDCAEGEAGQALTKKYTCFNSLQFVVEDAASTFADGLDSEAPGIDEILYGKLRTFEHRLEPVCAAEIVFLEGVRMVRLTQRINPEQAPPAATAAA